MIGLLLDDMSGTNENPHRLQKIELDIGCSTRWRRRKTQTKKGFYSLFLFLLSADGRYSAMAGCRTSLSQK